MSEKPVVAKTEAQDLQKQEHKEERTFAGRFFIPQTDIVENKESLIVIMDLPGIKALIKKPLDKAELAGTVRRVLDELKNPDEIFKDG